MFLVKMCSVQDVRFFARDSKEVELHGFLWTPRTDDHQSLVCVFVHPWAKLGGSSANTEPFAEMLATHHGIQCLTFDLRGVGKSTGNSTYKCFREIEDVLGACDFASKSLNKDVGHDCLQFIHIQIILVGTSAGAAIAGSCLSESSNIRAYVGIGYTFGYLSSWIFGGHFGAIMKSVKPKLFIMGSEDEFTSVEQLQARISTMMSARCEIINGVHHFELEKTLFVREVTEIITEFIRKVEEG